MYMILRTQRKRANCADPDKAAHYELPHLDLHSLQIQLVSFLMRSSINEVCKVVQLSTLMIEFMVVFTDKDCCLVLFYKYL